MSAIYLGLLGVSDQGFVSGNLPFEATAGDIVLIYLTMVDFACPAGLIDTAGNIYHSAPNGGSGPAGDVTVSIAGPPGTLTLRGRLYAGLVTTTTGGANRIKNWPSGAVGFAELWDGITLGTPPPTGFIFIGGASGSPTAVSASGSVTGFVSNNVIALVGAGRHEMGGVTPALSNVMAGWTAHNSRDNTFIEPAQPTFGFGDTAFSFNRSYNQAQVPSITADISGAGKWLVGFYNVAQDPPGPCTVTGTVTDFCDSEDLEGVSVLVDGVVQAVTGADGSYSISGIGEGLHELCYQKSGYTEQCEPFTCEG